MPLNWRKYDVIWMSAGLAVSGLLLWVADSRTPAGEHAAVLRAAVVERGVAFATGTNEPCIPKYDYLVTNTIMVTNFVAHIKTEQNMGNDPSTNIVIVEGANLSFYTTNWNVWQPVKMNVSATNNNYVFFRSYGDGYGTNYYAVETSSRNIVSNGGAVVNGLYLSWRYFNLKIPTNVSITVGVRLAWPPTNEVSSVLEEITGIYTNVVEEGRIDRVMRWKTMWDWTLQPARDMACFSNAWPVWLAEGYDSIVGGTLILRTPMEWVSANSMMNVGGGHTVNMREWTPMATATTGTNAYENVWTTQTRWPYEGVIWLGPAKGTNLPFCKNLAPSCEAHPETELVQKGSWWEEIGHGSTGYLYSCEKFVPDTNLVNRTTGSVTSRNHAVTMDKMNQASNILGRLNTTVYVCGIDRCTATSSWIVISRTNLIYSESFEPGLMPDFRKSALIEDLLAPGSNSWFAAAASPALVELYWYIHEFGNSITAYGESDHNYDYDGVIDCTWMDMRGLRAPHPCEWAFTNGYVERVKIFGVFSSEFASHEWESPAFPDDCTVTFNGGQTQTTSPSYGLFTTASTTVALPVPQIGSDVFDTFYALCSGGYHAISYHYASLIGEWNNPTSRPYFNIGTNNLVLSVEDPYSDADWGATHSYNNWDYQWRDWQAWTSVEVRLHYLVIVAEWKWRHLGSNPYEPEQWTPEWARTNTP